MNDFWNTRLILKVYAGSHSYGMDTETSDEDFRGICIPPAEYLLGLKHFEQHEHKEPDEVIYSLKKFVKLALDNNPNIIDALFVDDRHIVFINEFGQELRDLRQSFLSKRIFKTYGGYAVSRLKKLTESGKNPIGNKTELIEKYGYDTKDAAHLVRLMKMGIEILENGKVNVFRHDREMLLDIRNGKYPLIDITNNFDYLNHLLFKAYQNSQLPDEPDFEKINNWLVDVQKRSLDWNT
jgi:predicted nucleotidyltransferase